MCVLLMTLDLAHKLRLCVLLFSLLIPPGMPKSRTFGSTVTHIPGMYQSVDLLLEYCIEPITNSFVRIHILDWDIYSGFTTDRPCGVGCSWSTTCLLYFFICYLLYIISQIFHFYKVPKVSLNSLFIDINFHKRMWNGMKYSDGFPLWF